MRRYFLTPLIFGCLCFFALVSFAQQSTEPSQQEENVIKITTKLVQVDVVVTDKKGELVTDLKPEDFEVYEDKKKQDISNFSYIAAKQPDNVNGKAKPNPKVVINDPLKPGQVGRTIALVVDDLTLPFDSIEDVRSALKKFINEQMQPGDLVAIIRTTGSIGTLQQFTTNKVQLLAAVDQVQWNIGSRDGISTFEAVNPEVKAGKESEIRNRIFANGTLNTLRFIVNGLKELPGRKSVLFFSAGFPVFNRNDPEDSVLQQLRNVTDLANRSSVVFYTVDARGLQTLGLTAADDLTAPTSAGLGSTPNNIGAQTVLSELDRRRDIYRFSQEGLQFLASQTSGLFNVGVTTGIKEALEDQQGYYLLGYVPDESSFDDKAAKKPYHKLSIKVNRPGLKVRTRGGFYGIDDAALKKTGHETRGEQLVNALVSPFVAGDLGMKATTIFSHDAKQGNILHALFYIDGKNLTFEDEPDGWHKSNFDIVVMTFGDNGKIVDQVNRTHTIRLKNETFEKVRKDGFVYLVNVPVKVAGAYQLRAAIRDTASQKLGSAGQFVRVPELKKNKIELSGLFINSEKTANNTEKATALPDKQDDSSDSTDLAPAVRKFNSGVVLTYNYHIYNAKLDRNGQSHLKTQTRLFKDGKEIFTGNPQPFDTRNQKDPQKLLANGRLLLGTELGKGKYILQLAVIDELEKEKERPRTATQEIDFEIVN